ncbi:glycosyl hydrolase family 76-domain-containing protein [Irpex lacteus]|nr:glycosyl hydrolase family 76-domain-containing protein [Irpex lacteus]
MCRLSSLSVCLIPALVSQAAGQNFTIPSNWRKPQSNLQSSGLYTLVDGLLSTVYRTLNTNGTFEGLGVGPSASMLCALSNGDRINGSTTNKDIVLNSITTFFTLAPNITGTESNVLLNSDVAIWGLAAIKAYSAYHDPTALHYAQSAWVQILAYMVTPEEAAAGQHPMRNVPISTTCNGGSTAGAVFFIQNTPGNLNVNGESVAAFMALSAQLYEQTSNATYLSTAILSADFVLNQLYNGVLILDNMDLGTCTKSSLIFTYNSGFTIDGLSSLASANNSYKAALSDLVSTVIPNPAWTNASDGIIIEGPQSASDANNPNTNQVFRAVLIRSLYEVFSRSPQTSAEAALIRSFITVQLNALLDLASTVGSNEYSTRWEGPPPSHLLPFGQLAAVDVLYSAVGLVLHDSPSPPTASVPLIMTPGPSSSHDASATAISEGADSSGNHHALSSGAIGGMAAGIASLLIATALLAFLVRKRKQKHTNLLALEAAARPAYAASQDTHMRAREAVDGPLILPPSRIPRGRRTPQTSEVEEHTQVSQLTPSFSASENPPTSSSRSANPENRTNTSASSRPVVVDVSTLPGLVERLTRHILAERRPSVEDEEPPRYEE